MVIDGIVMEDQGQGFVLLRGLLVWRGGEDGMKQFVCWSKKGDGFVLTELEYL